MTRVKKIQTCIKSLLKPDQNESWSNSAPKKTSDPEKEGADEDGSPKRKRTRVRKTKRCHLCRKRGHIKRDCPFSLMLQD